MLAALFTGWQGFEAHQARLDSNAAASQARTDSQVALTQSRADAAEAMDKQLKAAAELRDQAKRSASAAEQTAKTASQQLEAAERPWIKVKPTLVTPLVFNSPVQVGETASANVQLVLENTGTTVALNVLTWTDIFPLDSNGGHTAALKRRSEWCDANRHPARKEFGSYIFPHEPLTQVHIVGPPMQEVTESAKNSDLRGKVGFVLVGCVSYRAPL